LFHTTYCCGIIATTLNHLTKTIFLIAYILCIITTKPISFLNLTFLWHTFYCSFLKLFSNIKKINLCVTIKIGATAQQLTEEQDGQTHPTNKVMIATIKMMSRTLMSMRTTMIRIPTCNLMIAREVAIIKT
jgi:hypothetical protein